MAFSAKGYFDWERGGRGVAEGSIESDPIGYNNKK